MDMNSISTLLKHNKTKGMLELSQYLDAGYTVGGFDSYFALHDENTRFVIIEKYPEKDEWTKEGEFSVKTLNINIELIPPPQKFITLDITINKDGAIE